MIRAKVAIVLMIVPLLAAIGIRYWPSAPPKGLPGISRIVMVDAVLYGAQDRGDLVNAFIAAIQECCNGKNNLIIVLPQANQSQFVDNPDALLQTAITLDAGLIEVDLQLVQPKTGKILWRDAFQAKQSRSAELMRSAAQSLFHALRG